MEEKRFTLRMDGDIFLKIEASAKRNNRTTAKEIQLAVTQYLDRSEWDDSTSPSGNPIRFTPESRGFDETWLEKKIEKIVEEQLNEREGK